MPGKLNKAATNSIAINIFLFIIKVAAGFISNSIAIISEAVNSLTDIVSSAAIRYALYVSKKNRIKIINLVMGQRSRLHPLLSQYLLLCLE